MILTTVKIILKGEFQMLSDNKEYEYMAYTVWNEQKRRVKYFNDYRVLNRTKQISIGSHQPQALLLGE
jgi:dTDP-4-dehydrorhamnose 3,5-epimerase-like enzyme